MKKKRNVALFDGCYYAVIIKFKEGDSRYYNCDYYDDILTILRCALAYDTKEVESIDIRCIDIG